MNELLERNTETIEALCRRYGVATLEVFGSAAGEDFDPERSDLDFLVTFHPCEQMGPADQYFGLLFALQETFGRQVDLVCANAMKNPYFIEEVNSTRRSLYAA
jgi:hypothetical protein